MHFNIHAAVPFLGLIINLVVTVILVKFGTTRLHRKFLLFNLAANLWLLQVFCYYLAPTAGIVDICSRITLPGMFLAPIATINFCYELCGHPRKQARINLVIMGAFTLFVIILNATGGFVSGYTRYGDIKWVVIPTPFYKIFITYFIWSILIYMPFLLIRTYRRTHDHKHRTQILYILAAIGISILTASTNFFSNLGLPVYPLGPLGTLAFTSLVTYAIIRHELLDIKVIIRKTILYSSLTFFISGIYAIILGIFTLLFQNLIPVHTITAGFLSIIVITFLFQPVRDRIQEMLERIFHRRKADYNRLLQEISSTLTRFTDPHNLFTWMGNHLLMSMQIEWIDLYLLNQETDRFDSVGRIRGKYAQPADAPVSFGKEEPPVSAILPGQTAIIKMDGRPPAGGTVILPLMFEDDMLGFYMLGPKLSEQPFDSEDETLLNTVSSQTTAAVRTINLFNEMANVRHVMFEQDKMAALGTLAFGIAHEIKNPLTPIKTFTHKMIGKAETPREKEMGARVKDEFRRVESMLNNLLNYGRTSEKKREDVDLNKVLADILVLFSADLRRSRIIRQERYDQDLPLVRLETNRLVQVFLNLITNAIQAMPEGGTLTVTTGRKKRDIEMSFRDTGTGIPADEIDRIFMPLYTSKPAGTGLGLAISNNIIKEYDGSIRVKSTPGEGSEFTILLPSDRNIL